MQFISRSRIFRKFAFRLIYPSANTLSISRRPRRKYLSLSLQKFIFQLKVSFRTHAPRSSRTVEYLLNCILHFGVGENKRESKKVLANAIASGYQFSNSSQVGVSPSAIMVLFWDCFVHWIQYQQTREKQRQREREEQHGDSVSSAPVAINHGSSRNQ